MKTKLGNKITNVPKNVIAAHMANLLSTRAIISEKERDFKQAFCKYKDICLAYLRENPKFIYSFGDDLWLDQFLDFQKQQHELLMQDVVFKFSDGSVWTIALNDIANLKIIHEPEKKHVKNKLLEDSIELIDWAQSNLSWSQLKNFATLKNIQQNDELYGEEWVTVSKKIIRWHYESDK